MVELIRRVAKPWPVPIWYLHEETFCFILRSNTQCRRKVIQPNNDIVYYEDENFDGDDNDDGVDLFYVSKYNKWTEINWYVVEPTIHAAVTLN